MSNSQSPGHRYATHITGNGAFAFVAHRLICVKAASTPVTVTLATGGTCVIGTPNVYGAEIDVQCAGITDIGGGEFLAVRI